MSRTRHPRRHRALRYYLERVAYLIRQTSRPIVRKDRVAAKETPARIALEPEIPDYDADWDDE